MVEKGTTLYLFLDVVDVNTIKHVVNALPEATQTRIFTLARFCLCGSIST